MENKTIKENTSNRSKHFGVVNLSIHYSLAAGLAEQLGDNVEGAVMSAIRKIGADNGKFIFDGAAIRMDPYWHRRQDPSGAVFPGTPENAVSIHLSHDLESELTCSVDWEWY